MFGLEVPGCGGGGEVGVTVRVLVISQVSLT